MTQTEIITCKRPDRTREIQSIIQRFSCNQGELQQKIQQTLEYGDEGMSFSHEFDDSPHYYLGWVYKKLSSEHQENFQKATLALLNSVVAYPDTTMQPEASDELLLMLHEVCKTNLTAQTQATDYLKAIIANDKTRTIQTELTSERTISLHERAVQMLVGFRTKEPLVYWNQLVKDYGETYAPLALGGIFNLDFDTGVQWLLEHQLPKVFDSFIQSLPYYYHIKFGVQRCDDAIATISTRVPQEYAHRLRNNQKSIKEWLIREAQQEGGE